MVHASSIHAFDQYTCGGRIDETSARSTESTLPVYDRSKWAGEIELRTVIDRGLDAVICNPTGVFGPLDYSAPLSRINRTLKDAARGRVPAMIGGGFDLVDVRDVAEGMTLAAERGTTGENYLLGGSMIAMFAYAAPPRRTAARRPEVRHLAQLVNRLIPVLEPIGKLCKTDIVSKAALGAPHLRPRGRSRQSDARKSVIGHGRSRRRSAIWWTSSPLRAPTPPVSSTAARRP